MNLTTRYFFFLSIIFYSSAFAQTPAVIKTYVDYYGKPTKSTNTLYWIETYKLNEADTYWRYKMFYNDTIPAVVVAIGTAADAEGQKKEGSFTYFYKNGVKSKEGVYQNNLKEGEWQEWNNEGKLSVRNNYKKGKKVGTNLSWFDNGSVIDSTILDENGNGNSFGFYDDGTKKAEGKYTAGDKNGLWTYYYRTPKNKKSIEVMYDMDSVKTYTCFTETGELQNKDCYYEREATFKDGDEGWKRYLIKKLTDKSRIYTKYLKTNEKYTAIVRFVIDKEGNTSDIKIEQPRNAEIDKLAISIIENSPKWLPAIQYNRKVNAYRRQPITFVAME